jgi:polar amino acid transport system substrate-binding protein
MCCVVLVLLLAGFDAVTNMQRGAGTAAPTVRATAAVDVVASGVLTVGSYTNYPPQIYVDSRTHQVEGFDADLIRAIGQRLGLRVEIVSLEFASLPEYVVNGDVDLAISAIPVTPSLQKKVQFVPYLQGGEALLVQQSNPLKITAVEELCGQRVGVKVDTLEQEDLTMQSENCKRNGKAPIVIAALADQQGVIQLLLKKQVVAVYQDAPQADYFMKQYPGRFELGGPITNTTIEGIAIRKDNSSLFQAVQRAMAAMHKDGSYRALIVKWGLLHEETSRS